MICHSELILKEQYNEIWKTTTYFYECPRDEGHSVGIYTYHTPGEAAAAWRIPAAPIKWEPEENDSHGRKWIRSKYFTIRVDIEGEIIIFSALPAAETKMLNTKPESIDEAKERCYAALCDFLNQIIRGCEDEFES